MLAATQSPNFGASSTNQDNQSVLSPFAAYSRIQQAMAQTAGSSSGPDGLYNPFHQFPYFSLTNAAQQFAAAAANANKNSSGSQHKVTSLLMNSSGGGSPSSSENNLSNNSLSLDSNHMNNQVTNNTESGASSLVASPVQGSQRKQIKGNGSNFNSPGSRHSASSPHGLKSPVNEFNCD